jgi:uncharacterized protein YbjT (DUF2867 family)
MYVITGATGNIGKRIAETLLSKGEKVRVIGRSQEKLKSLLDKGAEARAGNLEDSEFLMHAFRGAKAIFAMIPPNFEAEDERKFQDRVGESLVKAIHNSGVKQVVSLSSIGADRTEKTGPILGLHYQENRLNDLNGVNVVHLRPAFFMENHLTSIPVIQGMGVYGSALRPDLVFPQITTRDIADVATEELLSGVQGKSVRDLLGPEDLSMVQSAKILGKAIGREDLPYVQFSYEDSAKGMMGAGLSRSVTESILEMDRGANENGLFESKARNSKNSTKTTLQEFSKTFASVYNSQSK